MHFQPSKHTQYMSGLTIIPALRNRLLGRGPRAPQRLVFLLADYDAST